MIFISVNLTSISQLKTCLCQWRSPFSLYHPNSIQMLRPLHPNEKITDIIKKIGKKKLISIEINPYKPLDYNILSRINPSFCTVIWIAKLQDISQPNLLSPVMISKELVRRGYTVLVHIPEIFHANQNMKSILNIFKENGIRNIYIKRGDGPHRKIKNEFSCSQTLFNFIRDEYGDYFDLVTAGFPDETHYGSMENQMLFLRRKVTAGVNAILTKACVCPEKYFKFKMICTQYAIDVPIIFGICMWRSWRDYSRTKREFCGIDRQAFLDMKDPVEGKWQLAMIDNGREWSKHIVEELLKDEFTIGVHVFSQISSELVKNILIEINAHVYQANLRKFYKNV